MQKDQSSQSGRWTEEEHNLFLQGLQQFGKNWKLIEKMIQTRNGSQIRSHAQKYYLKLQKQSKTDKTAPKKSKSGKNSKLEDLDIKIEDENGVVTMKTTKSKSKNQAVAPIPPYPIDLEQMQYPHAFPHMYPPMQPYSYPMPIPTDPTQQAELQKSQQMMYPPHMGPYMDQPPLYQNPMIHGGPSPYYMGHPGAKTEFGMIPPNQNMHPMMFQQQPGFGQFQFGLPPMYRMEDAKYGQLMDGRKFSENIEQYSTADDHPSSQSVEMAKKQQQILNQQQQQIAGGMQIVPPQGSLLVKRKNSNSLIQGAEQEIQKKQQQISTTSYSNISQ